MNKLKFISLAVVCGMALASCVDNEESASVENLRNQKAGVYAANAELAKAQAAGEALRAAADAAYRNAETASQVELTRQAAERFINEMKDAARQQALADLEQQLAIAKLQSAIKNMTDSTGVNNLNSLLAAYQEHVGFLSTASNNLLGAQKSLIGLEAGLVTAQEVTLTKIAKETNDMNKQVAIVAQKKAEIAAYSAINDKPAAQAALDAATVASKALLSKEASAKASEIKTANAVAVALNAIQVTPSNVEATDYMKGVDILDNLGYVTSKTKALLEREFAYSDGTHSELSSLNTLNEYTIDSKAIAVQMAKNTAAVDTAVRELNKTDGVKMVYDKAVAAEAIAYDHYLAAIGTVGESDSLVKYNAKKNATVIAKSDYTTAYEDIYGDGTPQATGLVITRDKLAYANAAVTNAKAAYMALVDVFVAADAADLDAKIALAQIDYEKDIQNAIVTNLQNVVDNYTTIETAITSAEADIVTAIGHINTSKTTIVELEAGLDLNGVVAKERAIATAKADIDKYTAEVAAETALVKQFKAALDAALAA